MKKNTLKILIPAFLIIILVAATWQETKVTCPVCKKINKFRKIGSYNAYIYSRPEKLEYIYWPSTETFCLYTCEKCKYSAFMWDFVKLNGDTLEMLQEKIPDLRLYAENYEARMSKKMENAEKIYKIYKKDPKFWCKFYRIMGFHYANERKVAKAITARKKALSYTEVLLKSTSDETRKKELLLISGSMKYFTDQDSSAIPDLDKALTLVYNKPTESATKNKEYNNYLNGILNQLKLKSETKMKNSAINPEGN